ncbi:hypothetical protein COCNU_scaffold000512G000020 [Cocos nucifera]|nr:hypothetical protein [Cocos nucifera]
MSSMGSWSIGSGNPTYLDLMDLEITLKERSHLTQGIKTLKRKDGHQGELSKRARDGETSSAMPTQTVPVPKITMAMPSPTLSSETNTLALPKQGSAAEKRKKATARKVKRNVRGSDGESSSQEQDFLYDWEVIHTLMDGSILSHIIEKMIWKDDEE